MINIILIFRNVKILMVNIIVRICTLDLYCWYWKNKVSTWSLTHSQYYKLGPIVKKVGALVIHKVYALVLALVPKLSAIGYYISLSKSMNLVIIGR
jgi:hypothetical protein